MSHVEQKQSRVRSCDNHSPANEGANCTGSYKDIKMAPGLIGPNGLCVMSHVEQKQSRVRSCDNHPRANDGANCTGSYNDIKMAPGLIGPNGLRVMSHVEQEQGHMSGHVTIILRQIKKQTAQDLTMTLRWLLV